MSEKTFRVGYHRITVEPTEPIPLTGYSNEPKRFHQEVAQEICATCVAISDKNDNTVLMIGTDICTVVPEIYESVRQRVADATGIDDTHIYIAATHTHAAPAVGRTEISESMRRYADRFYDAIVEAAVKAMEDRVPAGMMTGSIETENMNFVKHYRARDNKTGEISYIGDCFGTTVGKTLVDHATKSDPTMHVVKFTRENAKDVVMVNFRAHPHFDGGSKVYKLSSDYIGAFRTALESLVDCHCVYFQGAAGNQNSSTRLPAERRYTSAVSYGLGLAGYAAECLHKYMKEVPTGLVKTKQVRFIGHINHTQNHLAEVGKSLRQRWNQDFDWNNYREEADSYGIRSPYHAGAIWWNSERNDEEHGWMILNAVAVGEEFAFVTFPGEMFDSISVRMEENSPYFTTMMLGYCYHHLGYLPSAVAYKYTSYETDITRFAPGTGEMVADKHVEMLKELKNG